MALSHNHSPNLRIVSDDTANTGVDAPDDFAGRVLNTLLDATGNAHTRNAKRRDLSDFANFYARDSLTPDVILRIVSLDAGGIIETLTAYKAWGRERGLSPATINRRLASVRALLRVASQLGAACPDPRGLVRDEKNAGAYRDTEGPPIEDVARLLAALDRTSVKGKRDYALLMLSITNALRRNEALACDVGDFNAKRGRLRIRGKGRNNQKETITLDEETTAAISAYLAARPDALRVDSPLFASCDRSSVKLGAGLRLGGHGWAKAVTSMGLSVLGERLHPHGFRHSAATAALVATGGDVPRVQSLTRHKSPSTLLLYLDRTKDEQGEMTKLIAGLLRDARANAK